MRVFLASVSFAMASLTGFAAEARPQIGELGICYEPIFGRGSSGHSNPVRVVELYGDLGSHEVLGAKLTLGGGHPKDYVATGRLLSANDSASQATGTEAIPSDGSRFELKFVRMSSWVSFVGELEYFADETGSETIEVECFDRHFSPERRASRRPYVVGSASRITSQSSATPEVVEHLKPKADREAAYQCPGATRVTDYITTFEPVGSKGDHISIVTAHYRC